MTDIQAPAAVPAPLSIVTGASRGIGRAVALELARGGGDVVVTYRSDPHGAEVVAREIADAGRRSLVVELDVASAASIERFADSLARQIPLHFARSGFDHLVNNAGHGSATPLAATPASVLDELWRVHARGPFLLVQALHPMMADGGAIVNLSSALARVTAPGNSMYGAMKAALEHLTRYWAKELGPRGIRVNAVAPGPVATDFAGGRNRDDDELRARLASQTSLGRVGVVDDIAPLVAALTGGSHAWVTGQRLEASGGIFL